MRRLERECFGSKTIPRIAPFFAAVVAAVGAALAAHAAGAQPNRGPDSTNAADHYREAARAIEALPDADRGFIDSTADLHLLALYSPQSSWSTQTLVRFPRSVPTDESAAGLVARLAPALSFFHRGAASAECDWGFDFQSGNLSAPLPQLPIVGDIVACALFDARYHWALGEQDRAVDDLQALKTFATHVGAAGDGGLISLVVQFNIERVVVHTIARWLTDAASAENLRHAAQEPGRPGFNLAQKAILLETKTVLPLARRLIDTSGLNDEQRRERYATELFTDGLTVGQLVKRYSEDKLLMQIAQSRDHYQEVGRLLDLPATVFQDKFDDYMHELEKEENFFSTVGLVQCPGIERVFYDVKELHARWRMLQAAVDVVRYGTGILPKHDDPFGDGPFAFTRTAEGFELRSELEVNGAQITMIFTASPAT